MRKRVSTSKLVKFGVAAFSFVALLAPLYGQATGSRRPTAGNSAASPSVAADSSNNDVTSIIELVHSGFPEALILKNLGRSGKTYDLSPSDLLRLKKEGVPEKVIAAMLEPSAGPAPATPAASTPIKPETQPVIAPSAPSRDADTPPQKSVQDKKSSGGFFGAIRTRVMQSAQDSANRTVQTSLDSADTKLQNGQAKVDGKIQNTLTPGQSNGNTGPSTSQAATRATRATWATPATGQSQMPAGPATQSTAAISNPTAPSAADIDGIFKCSPSGATVVLRSTGSQATAVLNSGIPGQPAQTFSGIRYGSTLNMTGSTGVLRGSASNSSVRLINIGADGTRKSVESCTRAN